MSNDRRKNRYRLKPDEEEILFKYRGIKQEAEKQGIDVETVKHGWFKSDNSSLFVKNPAYKDQAIRDLEQLKEGLIKWVNSESKTVKKNPKRKGENLLLIDPAGFYPWHCLNPYSHWPAPFGILQKNPTSGVPLHIQSPGTVIN